MAAIARIRAVAKQAAQSGAVNEYVHAMVVNVRELVHAYTDAHGGQLGDFLAAANPQDKKSAGQVFETRVHEVIDSGNLRERMTLMMNFVNRGCQVVYWLLSETTTLPPCVSRKAIRELRDRIRTLTGLSVEKLSTIVPAGTCDSTTGCALPCKMTFTSRDGPVPWSRSVTAPFNDALRAVRKGAQNVRIADAFPLLSDRERDFMGLVPGETKLPWCTGEMYYSIMPANLYSRIAKTFGHPLIAGPSGATDLLLCLHSLFTSWNVDLSTLACVAWMGNPPDHSVFEVLIAAIPFGLDYDSSVDAFAHTERMLQTQAGGRRPAKKPAAKQVAAKKPAAKQAAAKKPAAKQAVAKKTAAKQPKNQS